jgi:putative SOS response-associated peptidase YedK
METAAIVTTQANAEMGQVHHRAPVIVPPEQFDFWLDCRSVDETMAAELIVPAPDGLMEVYEVSPAVNRVANDEPSLHEPYDAATEPSAEAPKPARKLRQPADTGQGSLF